MKASRFLGNKTFARLRFCLRPPRRAGGAGAAQPGVRRLRHRCAHLPRGAWLRRREPAGGAGPRVLRRSGGGGGGRHRFRGGRPHHRGPQHLLRPLRVLPKRQKAAVPLHGGHRRHPGRRLCPVQPHSPRPRPSSWSPPSPGRLPPWPSPWPAASTASTWRASRWGTRSVWWAAAPSVADGAAGQTVRRVPNRPSASPTRSAARWASSWAPMLSLDPTRPDAPGDLAQVWTAAPTWSSSVWAMSPP